MLTPCSFVLYFARDQGDIGLKIKILLTFSSFVGLRTIGTLLEFDWVVQTGIVKTI